MKSRNQNNTTTISNIDQAFRSTQMTNMSTKVGNYPNLGFGIDQLNAFNNSTLFIKGGVKPIIQENQNTFSKTFMKDIEDKDIHMHRMPNNIREEVRPMTAGIQRYTSQQKQQSKGGMIIIPTHSNTGNIAFRESSNNAATSTNNVDPSNSTSIML